MLCDKCGKNPATTHYTQIINGQKKEYHLCSQCAQAMGGQELFSGFPNLFGSLFSQPSFQPGRSAQVMERRCSRCGTSFSDIAETGLMGCADCYNAFLKELTPSISRIHGKTAHVGKVPKSAGGNVKLKNQLMEAKRKLQEAIEAEEFEKAVTLRDEIRELNERLGEGNDNK